MARSPSSSRSIIEPAGRLARRALYLAAVSLGLALGLAAGLLGLVAGGDPTIVATCLLAGIALGWLSARAILANRQRLVRIAGVWLLGRALPGSRATRLLVSASTAARLGAHRR